MVANKLKGNFFFFCSFGRQWGVIFKLYSPSQNQAVHYAQIWDEIGELYHEIMTYWVQFLHDQEQPT